MGQLKRWPVERLVSDHSLVNFVETGTWKADGLLHAMRSPFLNLFSIEVDQLLWSVAIDRVMFEQPGDVRWDIRLGESLKEVAFILDGLTGPTLWWLDAHLPERYGGAGPPRLPLADEVQLIVDHGRDHSKDVFIMDDWRLYERYAYGNGNFPGGPVADPAPIRQALAATHHLNVSALDEGYMVAKPK